MDAEAGAVGDGDVAFVVDEERFGDDAVELLVGLDGAVGRIEDVFDVG